MAIASGIVNLFLGGLGIIDVILGGLTTFIVCFTISRLKNDLLIIPIITIGVSVLISSYLHFLLGVPLFALMFYIFLGQIIPAVLAVLIIRKLT